jgi:hypothetical protein
LIYNKAVLVGDDDRTEAIVINATVAFFVSRAENASKPSCLPNSSSVELPRVSLAQQLPGDIGALRAI